MSWLRESFRTFQREGEIVQKRVSRYKAIKQKVTPGNKKSLTFTVILMYNIYISVS